ncbi:hypothetical protein FOQG_05231 [Fusarium oxysporum f. sp. raphani 54005]|uniref:Uncharacterized protein n=3 Tax=Fusarium oxysporum TaxID=5507 RepID=X0DEP8_FUSOX|nr:hypothetical protein FOVG_10871 [Fusarium oxysporum f. sp. pisi HDV247]EXK92992.1 hypothetical protein FOQG_05231 [Fusarium oxysporum f. sp. raphani 54005]EXL82893.1 hypothetical protein FOPG_04319 [Fusarium oxysporum f. sp. conglutinans race 2 54008]KAJ4047056.1 hypothetical protein NW763_010305 [Fusarium oxysporum]KAJ4048002.1 hypothetical protein NW753_008946 [Fusarium oxysporum]
MQSGGTLGTKKNTSGAAVNSISIITVACRKRHEIRKSIEGGESGRQELMSFKIESSKNSPQDSSDNLPFSRLDKTGNQRAAYQRTVKIRGLANDRFVQERGVYYEVMPSMSCNASRT